MRDDHIQAREILLLLAVAARIVLPVLAILILTVLAGYGLFMLLFG